MNNLPLQLTSFVGRERELTEISGLLGDTRLLTLVGPGGCGKTRLALAAAARAAGTFEDGVWWVELTSLSRSDLVPQAVSQALSVREQPGAALTDTLVEALREKRLLLVLDNCEHLIEGCAWLSHTMLASCPGLRILATSREALGVAGESSWRVPSLAAPGREGHLPHSAEDLARYGAIELFVARARSKVSTFELTNENAGAVAEVCQKLDGIPLAIELAAARVGVLSAKQISEKLMDPLRLLSGGSRTSAPRHQTLRATLEWDYDLLSEQERRLFERLSVFAGGWTLEAAEAVGAKPENGIEGGDVLDLLSHLADKSLLAAGAGGDEDALRYRMLEPMRQYGRELLDASGEEKRVRDRHVDYFLELAERATPELKGPGQVPWLERLAAEQENLRASMRWLLERKRSEEAARFGWALWIFWWFCGTFAEGRGWMEEALEQSMDMPASARARALFVAGTMSASQADFDPASMFLEESEALFRELGDEHGVAFALGSAGIVAVGRNQPERAISNFEESVRLLLEVGDKWAAAFILGYSAVARFLREDRTHARQLAERGLSLSREVGDKQGASVTLYILARLAQAERDHERAREMFAEGLELTAAMRELTTAAYCLEGLAGVAAARDRTARAARLWGAVEALLEEIETAPYPYAPGRALHDTQVNAARSRLGGEAFAAEWSVGRAMTADEAIEYALGRETSPPVAVASYPAGLSAREAEVLKLVAKGLTSAQVGTELYISQRTVNRHLGSIYAKIGVNSRAAATRFAADNNLL